MFVAFLWRKKRRAKNAHNCGEPAVAGTAGEGTHRQKQGRWKEVRSQITLGPRLKHVRASEANLGASKVSLVPFLILLGCSVYMQKPPSKLQGQQVRPEKQL